MKGERIKARFGVYTNKSVKLAYDSNYCYSYQIERQIDNDLLEAKKFPSLKPKIKLCWKCQESKKLHKELFERNQLIRLKTTQSQD